MSTLREGGLASYVGDEPHLDLGSQGEILAFAGRGAWVKWLTGSQTGQTLLVDQDDLAALRGPQAAAQPRYATRLDDLDDSLDVGITVRTGMAQVQLTQGTQGVLTLLASQGRLRQLHDAPQEALAVVAHRVRQDPTIREVTAQLDDDDAEQLVQLTAASLLHDAFGSFGTTP